ncbi:uncharacterized protein LOC105693530 isoform X1 [Athalia rosae]|uniref:uncharacterized protein LOC105693530 isoform X1 n=2 Tax=Athalia rosae TaxID=37344 RepID=UPI002034A114|nr:uncharacterized protein LOC105693530 isoform X1 [Athalia rosae]
MGTLRCAGCADFPQLQLCDSTIMLHIMSPEDVQKYANIKRKGVAFWSSLFRVKRFAASGMRIEDEEMDRAPRVETPAAVISNAHRNNNAVARIPSTLSVAAVDVVVGYQPHPSPSHSILTLTPGRTRNIDQDMEALRLSRQDNPFLQVLASRESLVESIEESESDDAILMSQELGDADPLTLAQVHEHLVRSPPPATWPHTPMFHFPHPNNQNQVNQNCGQNSHLGNQAGISDPHHQNRSPHILLGNKGHPKSPGQRGAGIADSVVELSRSEPSADYPRDRHSHPFSLLNPTPIRSLSEVRRLHRSADDNVQLMSSE